MLLKYHNFKGDVPRWFIDCGEHVPPSPRFRRPRANAFDSPEKISRENTF